MIFFNLKLECDYWRKIAAFFIATSHYNATNSLNTTANHTASDSQLLFACKPFLATKKVSFLQLIEKDETFKGICLDKIAQSDGNKCQTPLDRRNTTWASCKTQWIIQGSDLVPPRSLKPMDALIVHLCTIASKRVKTLNIEIEYFF